VKEGATYQVELPLDMKRQGICSVFDVSLLKLHVPYNDGRFPGRNYQQVVSLQGDEDEWTVDHIASHRGKGTNVLLEIVGLSGDRTWEPLNVMRHLEALKQFLKHWVQIVLENCPG
jgi:hypothetical protein